MVIQENRKEYLCSNGHKFEGKNVKLVPFSNGQHSAGLSPEHIGNVMFERDGRVFRGGLPTSGSLLACPECGLIQLAGFQAATCTICAPSPASV